MKSSISLAVTAAAMGFASKFNQMISPLKLDEFAPHRKRGFRTGIKGVKSSNNTQFGATLKAHFDSKRKANNKVGRLA